MQMENLLGVFDVPLAVVQDEPCELEDLPAPLLFQSPALQVEESPTAQPLQHLAP